MKYVQCINIIRTLIILFNPDLYQIIFHFKIKRERKFLKILISYFYFANITKSDR